MISVCPKNACKGDSAKHSAREECQEAFAGVSFGMRERMSKVATLPGEGTSRSSQGGLAMAEEVKESTKEKSSVGRVLQIGGAVVGTLVGSGFASGQEVMQYFTAYGIPGVWALRYHGAVRTYVRRRYVLRLEVREIGALLRIPPLLRQVFRRVHGYFLGAVLLPCRHCYDLWLGCDVRAVLRYSCGCRFYGYGAYCLG